MSARDVAASSPPEAGRAGQARSSFGLMADFWSVAKLAAVKAALRLPFLGRRMRGRPFSFRITELGGRPLRLRAGTSDLGTLYHDYVRHEHLPPPPVASDELRFVCELGSNVGTGLAGLAARYPSAVVLGVEPDAANAALARQNVAAFGDRCRVVESAIWHRSERLAVRGEHPSGYTVEPAGQAETSVSGLTIDALLAEAMPGERIDYICFNLEGAEDAVLEAGGEWAARTRSVRCELHPQTGFSAERCTELLSALGFRAWAEPEAWGGWGFGVRDGEGPRARESRR